MGTWEYKVIDLKGHGEIERHEEILNKMAKDGWELVAVTSGYGIAAYLKRRKD